jgi:hypothetical protein
MALRSALNRLVKDLVDQISRLTPNDRKADAIGE